MSKLSSQVDMRILTWLGQGAYRDGWKVIGKKDDDLKNTMEEYSEGDQSIIIKLLISII